MHLDSHKIQSFQEATIRLKTPSFTSNSMLVCLTATVDLDAKQLICAEAAVRGEPHGIPKANRILPGGQGETAIPGLLLLSMTKI